MNTSEMNALLKKLVRLFEEVNVSLKNSTVTPTTPTTSSLTSLVYNVSSQTTVTIPHNLNRYVIVMAFDNLGNKMDTNENQGNLNTLSVSFNPAFTGKIIIY